MSINLASQHLKHCIDVSMTFNWELFSARQQKSIIKPLREGVVKDSECTTAQLSRRIASKCGVPLIKVSQYRLEIPFITSPLTYNSHSLIDLTHPVWNALMRHYQMCKVLCPDIRGLDENIEELEKLLNCKAYPHRPEQSRYNWDLYFTYDKINPKVFTQFKKDLVTPVKLKPEDAEFLNRLEKGLESNITLSLDLHGWNHDYINSASITKTAPSGTKL